MNRKEYKELAQIGQKLDDFAIETRGNFQRINGSLVKAQRDATISKALVEDHIKDVKVHSALNGSTGLTALWNIIKLIIFKK